MFGNKVSDNPSQDADGSGGSGLGIGSPGSGLRIQHSGFGVWGLTFKVCPHKTQNLRVHALSLMGGSFHN